MAEKDIILEEKTTEEKTTVETKEEVKEETPLEDVVLETEGGTKSLLGATNSTDDIAATSLDTKTTPAGTDNLILFNQNTNVGYQIDYDNLADAILNKLTSKTFTNQVGGSSAATLLAQLATLNSNISYSRTQVATEYKNAPIDFFKFGRVVVIQTSADMLALPQGFTTLCEVPEGYRPSLNVVYGYSANYNGYRYFRIENYKDLIVYNPTATNTTNGGFVFVYMV